MSKHKGKQTSSFENIFYRAFLCPTSIEGFSCCPGRKLGTSPGAFHQVLPGIPGADGQGLAGFAFKGPPYPCMASRDARAASAGGLGKSGGPGVFINKRSKPAGHGLKFFLVSPEKVRGWGGAGGWLGFPFRPMGFGFHKVFPLVHWYSRTLGVDSRKSAHVSPPFGTCNKWHLTRNLLCNPLRFQRGNLLVTFCSSEQHRTFCGTSLQLLAPAPSLCKRRPKQSRWALPAACSRLQAPVASSSALRPKNKDRSEQGGFTTRKMVRNICTLTSWYLGG